MTSNQQPSDQGISIQQLQQDLGVFQVRLDQKLKQLTTNFSSPTYQLDVNKSYYDHFSNFDAQFKEITNDLTQFLIKDELASTPTLRSTFYKVLESPLFCLFKSSKFELFELCLNGFDIEYEPDEAIKEVHKGLLKNTEGLKGLLKDGWRPNKQELELKIFSSINALLFYSYLKSIQFKIFTLYSYIRKGAQFLKKQYQHRLFIAQMFASIQKQLIPILVSLQLIQPLKQLTTLNFQIVNIEPTYDYFFFFFSIPPQKQFLEVYQSINLMVEKCEKNRNYNPFVIFVLKHYKELNLFIGKKEFGEEFIPYVIALIHGGIRLLRAEVGLYEEFVSVLESLLNLSKKHYEILEKFLVFKPVEEKEQLISIKEHWREEVLNKKLPFLFTLKELTFEQVKERLEKAQEKYLFSLTFPDIQNTRLKGMLQLTGGNPQKFFEYSEKDFKTWNSTASITGKYKYIESQFNKFQEITDPLSSVRTINNFLHVSGLYGKEYEALYESKLSARFFFDLLEYFLKNQGSHKTLGIELEFFILNCLELYSLTKDHKDFLKIQEKVRYLTTFANASYLVHTANNQVKYISNLSKQIELLKYDLSTKEYINLLTTIAISLPNTKQQCLRSILSSFIDLDSINQKVKANRFHEEPVFTFSDQHISKQQARILKQNYSIFNNRLTTTNLALFKFTNQDVSTNPLNFESRIDDIFISLTSNSKKVIQIIILEIVEEIKGLQNTGKETSVRLEFLLEIIRFLCTEYPIVLPYIVSLKISTKSIKQVSKNEEIKMLLPDSVTFGEFLCQAELLCKANQAIPELIISLLRERSIRYLNGKDYVKQEIAPTISEALVKIVNQQRGSKTLKEQIPKILSLLVLSLESQDKLEREQVEIVKGLLLVLRQEISTATDASRMLELSSVYKNCIKLFFKYKGNELNKPLLESTYAKYGNTEIQNYDISDKPSIPVVAIDKLKNQTLLNFSVNIDFDLENSKLIKHEIKQSTPTVYDISFKDTLRDIKTGTNEIQTNIHHDQNEKKLNIIDIQGGKYNLLYHLGEEKLNTICSRTESQFKLSGGKIYPEKQLTNEQEELRNIVAFYGKEVFVPGLSDAVLEGAVVRLLEGSSNELDFLRNVNNFEKVIGLLTALLIKDYSTLQSWGDNEVTKFLKSIKIDSDQKKYEEIVNRIFDIFSQIGYSNLWVYSFKDLTKKQLKSTQSLLTSGTPTPPTQSLLSLILTFILQSHVSQKFTDLSKFSHFIKSYFSARPEQNQILTYKVTVNKTLLNLILKCIDFEHLNYVSILFYSNFENLRLYTDDLQEGFKALNLASKTRAYNEFIRLSNQYNDVEYLNPLKIFKENLKFFTKIEKEGYLFKVEQEAAITVERIINQVKSPTTTAEQIDAILDQYFIEVNKLKANTINRVKSIYLSSKLRDLSLQNGTTISLLYEVLKKLNLHPIKITEQINKIQLFSIICSIHFDLLSFNSAYNNLDKYANYSHIDEKSLTEDIVFSTTKRFGFSMNRNLNELEFEFDEVVQSALVNAKSFLVSDLGNEWIETIVINPALPTYNRVRIQKARTNLITNIESLLLSNHEHPAVATIRQQSLCQDLVRQLSSLPTANFLKKDGLIIQLDGTHLTLDKLADKVISEAIKKQIILKIDQSYIINKNKFSEDSLDVLKAIGFIIGYCIFWKVKLDLPLHHSIICQICSTIVDLDDLLSVDFKTWEYLRMVLSEADSKTLNLNFSYEFDSIVDPSKKEKIELVDKGVQKKVNNLNREEYVDFICCRILFGNVRLQLERLLTGVYKVLPKQYISNLKFNDILQTFYKTQNKQLTNKLTFQNLKKFGVILPETYTSKDTSFQNLKDYVNINWLIDSLQELPIEKYHKFSQVLGVKEAEFLNIMVYTRTGTNESLELLPGNTVIINHFKTKEGLKAALVGRL